MLETEQHRGVALASSQSLPSGTFLNPDHSSQRTRSPSPAYAPTQSFSRNASLARDSPSPTPHATLPPPPPAPRPGSVPVAPAVLSASLLAAPLSSSNPSVNRVGVPTPLAIVPASTTPARADPSTAADPPARNPLGMFNSAPDRAAATRTPSPSPALASASVTAPAPAPIPAQGSAPLLSVPAATARPGPASMRPMNSMAVPDDSSDDNHSIASIDLSRASLRQPSPQVPPSPPPAALPTPQPAAVRALQLGQTPSHTPPPLAGPAMATSTPNAHVPRPRDLGESAPPLAALSPLLPDTPDLPGMQSMHGHVDDSLPYAQSAVSAPASPPRRISVLAHPDGNEEHPPSNVLPEAAPVDIVVTRNASGLMGLSLESLQPRGSTAQGGVFIAKVAPDAQVSGPRMFEAGDRVLAIDGQVCSHMSLSEVQGLLRNRNQATVTVRSDLARFEALHARVTASPAQASPAAAAAAVASPSLASPYNPKDLAAASAAFAAADLPITEPAAAQTHSPVTLAVAADPATLEQKGKKKDKKKDKKDPGALSRSADAGEPSKFGGSFRKLFRRFNSSGVRKDKDKDKDQDKDVLMETLVAADQPAQHQPLATALSVPSASGEAHQEPDGLPTCDPVVLQRCMQYVLTRTTVGTHGIELARSNHPLSQLYVHTITADVVNTQARPLVAGDRVVAINGVDVRRAAVPQATALLESKAVLVLHVAKDVFTDPAAPAALPAAGSQATVSPTASPSQPNATDAVPATPAALLPRGATSTAAAAATGATAGATVSHAPSDGSDPTADAASLDSSPLSPLSPSTAAAAVPVRVVQRTGVMGSMAGGAESDDNFEVTPLPSRDASFLTVEQQAAAGGAKPATIAKGGSRPLVTRVVAAPVRDEDADSSDDLELSSILEDQRSLQSEATMTHGPAPSNAIRAPHLRDAVTQSPAASVHSMSSIVGDPTSGLLASDYARVFASLASHVVEKDTALLDVDLVYGLAIAPSVSRRVIDTVARQQPLTTPPFGLRECGAALVQLVRYFPNPFSPARFLNRILAEPPVVACEAHLLEELAADQREFWLLFMDHFQEAVSHRVHAADKPATPAPATAAAAAPSTE
eukprot:m.220585 g.220585  ORF g.220585 m.220585 type:complete len:1100 (-) comp15616_c1_seq1:370-3669(-)